MNIVELIKLKKWDEIETNLNDNNIHFNTNGVNFLWVAINGNTGRIQKMNTGFADYGTVNLLLKKGINPNKKCILMTNLYVSVIHKRSDIIRLLLMFDTNPNDFCLIKVSNKMMICDVPLNLAIRNFEVNIVQLLIQYGAFYNNITITKVEEYLKFLSKKKEYESYNRDYKKLNKILEILKDNYKGEFENKVKEYINNSTKTGSYRNFFPCFENDVNEDIKEIEQPIGKIYKEEIDQTINKTDNCVVNKIEYKYPNVPTTEFTGHMYII